uniref:DDE Tnp4 domain-containing protein n=1 Tax=Fagus sylvatica TaxID=28930 RepID=A0A2N9E563_FAGSY
MASQPGDEPREEVERATDRSVWLQSRSSSPSPTDGSYSDTPLFHETQEEERELDEQYRYGRIHVNVDAGSDDENVQVPPNMGKVKRPTHGEKVSRQRFKRRIAKTSASCVGESKRKLERFSLDKAVQALSVYKDMPRTTYLKVMKALYKKENRSDFSDVDSDTNWSESEISEDDVDEESCDESDNGSIDEMSDNESHSNSEEGEKSDEDDEAGMCDNDSETNSDHSTETVQHRFRCVLRAIHQLGMILIKPDLGCNELPPSLHTNGKYYPWFKKCVGAIDGTHVSARAPAEKANSCRGRKHVITQNVMCACNFDMKFTFVCSGWEGSANDSRVFEKAITSDKHMFPWPAAGSYYLMDNGYPMGGTFLPPHKSVKVSCSGVQSTLPDSDTRCQDEMFTLWEGMECPMGNERPRASALVVGLYML